MTSRPPRHSADETPTLRVSLGSVAVADGLRTELIALAGQLEALDVSGPPATGRPCLRVAHQLRRIERRVATWHDAHTPRTLQERDQDYRDAAQWMDEGRALMPQGGT